MKTRLIIAVTLTLLLSITANAKIWRVNNNAGISADFTTAQSAHDGASTGDTLFFEGSNTSYGALDATKKLIILGPGYYLEENENTQVSKLSAKISKITFKIGSEFSKICGIDLTNTGYQYDADIQTDNITIIRCLLFQVKLNSSNHCIVSQNVCITNFGIIGTASNSIFNNNIILGQINLASTGTGNVIKNNYIKTTLRVHGSHLRNNLVKGGIITDNGNNDSYNISDVGTGISDYFKSDASSSDGEYMLSDTSPAKNSGEDGVDCGPFGGTNPYVLSGIPKGPHIYDATIGTSANKEDGLDISIKIKTQL